MDNGLFGAIYNPDVLSCLANLSNDEVFTPPEVVNQMLDMEIKKYVLAVFSPTGGTVKVARAICKGTGLEGLEIDLCAEPEPREIGEDTLLIAAMPVYENRIREVALRRLSRLHGNNSPAVAVVVYGNRDYGDALLELTDTLQESGFVVPAAAAFIAEHSIIRSIAAGRPDAEDLKQAEAFGAQAAAKIKAQDSIQNVTVPGDPDYRSKKRGTGVPPLTDDTCNACGACAAACPVGRSRWISRIPPRMPVLAVCAVFPSAPSTPGRSLMGSGRS